MGNWTRKKLISEYIEFFKSKNHKEIPNSPLIPEIDPTVLFTTAGMHPLVPFLLGQPHPQGKRLVNVQKCIRTGDIDEVGDEVHHTFFEMLGNWSLGDYWKKEAIEYSFEFLTKKLKIKKEDISISCFAGDKDAPKDNESAEIWLSLGIPKERISFLGKDENWWGPAGLTGPCGPDTEMFVNKIEIWNDVFMQYVKVQKTILVDGMFCLYDKDFQVNEELSNYLTSLSNKKILVVDGNKKKAEEIARKYGFEVFSLEENKITKESPEFFKKLINKYNLSSKELIYFDHAKENVISAKKLSISSEIYVDNNKVKEFIEDNATVYLSAKQKNVDTGMGVERTLAVLSNLQDNYLTECFLPIIKEIEKLSRKKYGKDKGTTQAMRIIADHIKASVFILAEKIQPSNKERGYVLRRLIRRAVRYSRELGIKSIISIAYPVFDIYSDYPILKNKKIILQELEKEEIKFSKTLEQGMSSFNRLIKNNKEISGKDAFLLYQSYGFPVEMTCELAKEKNVKLDLEGCKAESEKHQELSKTASAGIFKSGLADNSEATTKLHTSAHLLLAALKKVLGKDVHQRGSNITQERLRFDFSFPRKLTEEEIKKIEDLVNQQIKKKIPVKKEELTPEQAKKSGAEGVFEDKYKNLEKVFVYSIANFSREICSGPHVKNTGELGRFKIIKEESVAAGVRRIKAILE